MIKYINTLTYLLACLLTNLLTYALNEYEKIEIKKKRKKEKKTWNENQFKYTNRFI